MWMSQLTLYRSQIAVMVGIEFIIWQIFKTSCSDMMNRPIICFHIGIKKINAELNYRSVSFVNRLCHFPAYVVTC